MVAIEFRAVEEEYEARLAPPNGGRASGHIEWKTYSSGATRLKLSARKLDEAENFAVQLFVDDVPLGETVVCRGRVRWELDSREGDQVPVIADYQIAELRADGAVLLRGVFEPD